VSMSVPVLRTWMQAVSEISRSVNVADPIDVILTRIADYALELIGFDFCAVMLADRTADRLEIVGSSGLSGSYLEELRDDSSLQIHPTSPEVDSPAARAVRGKLTIAVSDVLRDAEVYGRLRLSSLQGYHSLVASPLRSEEEEPIGVLVGYSSAPRVYGNADVELTELLAEQTAAAIHTARMRARREWAERQHRRLMQLVLDEAGLEGLVEALADVLGASVAVVDIEDRLVATAGDGDHAALSEPPLPPQAPSDRQPSYATRHVEYAGGDAWVTPVVIAGDIAAHLWVLGEQAVSDTTRGRLVEQFALVVGIQLLTARHALEIEERLSGDLLSDVLRDAKESLPRVLLERGEALGFILESGQHVVVVSAENVVERLSSVTRSVRTLLHTKVLATSYGEHVVLLVPDVRDVLSSFKQVHHQLTERLSSPVAVVISPHVGCPDEIRSAYLAASGAARLRQNAGADGVVDLRGLSVLGLLLMAGSPTVYLRRLADQLIAPVAAQDEQRDAQLLPTLRAWLGSGFSAARAAEALTVHVNTVGQRLGRIETLTRRDLKLPDTRMDLQLALHVWEIVQFTPDR